MRFRAKAAQEDGQVVVRMATMNDGLSTPATSVDRRGAIVYERTLPGGMMIPPVLRLTPDEAQAIYEALGGVAARLEQLRMDGLISRMDRLIDRLGQ